MKTMADHMMDIIQNSITASATLIEVIVKEDLNVHLYTVTIRDNGRGMTKEEAANALDPFFTSRKTRKVGMGLPLLKQNAEQSGGSVSISSEPGRGTTVTATFGLHHIDRPPSGDIPGVFVLLAAANPGISFHYEHLTDQGAFSVTTESLNEALGPGAWQLREIRDGVGELIRNGLAGINAVD